MARLCLLAHTRVITHNALTVKLSRLIYGTASEAGRERAGGGWDERLKADTVGSSQKVTHLLSEYIKSFRGCFDVVRSRTQRGCPPRWAGYTLLMVLKWENQINIRDECGINSSFMGWTFITIWGLAWWGIKSVDIAVNHYQWVASFLSRFAQWCLQATSVPKF